MPGIEALQEQELLATFIVSTKLVEISWYRRVFLAGNNRMIKARLLTQIFYKSWSLESLTTIDTHDFGQLSSTLAQRSFL